MKKIYFFLFAALSLLAASCTKLDLDKSGDMGYDAGLGLPICKFHTSVFDILQKADTSGVLYVNPVDNTIHVYWTGKEQKMVFDFAKFDHGGQFVGTLDLAKVSSLKPILDLLPAGASVTLPQGVYTFCDTVRYNFAYNSRQPGVKDVEVDSIIINESNLSLVSNVNGLTLDNDNHIELTLTLLSVKDCTKSSVTVDLTGSRESFDETLSQFVADFSNQTDSNYIDISMGYKIVSSGTARITKGANIGYTMQINDIDFNTTYGRFWQKDAIKNVNIGMKMPEALRNNGLLKNGNLYFHDPEIVAYVRHDVGADIKYTMDYIRTLDKNGNPLRYADFNGSQSHTDKLNRPYTPHAYSNDTLLFNRNNGATNRLFEVIPDSMEMSCSVYVGKENGGHNDFLVNPMQMFVSIDAHMEMTFDAGTNFAATDTLGADLTSIDTAFTNYVNIDTFNIMLGMVNSLPVAVSVDMLFLDKDKKEIYRVSDIKIEAPEVDAEGVTIAPTAQDVVLSFFGDDVQTILKTKYICTKMKVTGHDAQSMISIHADDAVDISVRAYAKFKAKISKIL